MAEAKKQRALSKKEAMLSAYRGTLALTQTASKPVDITANKGSALNEEPASASMASAPKPILKSEKPPRGPNYCDVCCFEFSSSEVHNYIANIPRVLML